MILSSIAWGPQITHKSTALKFHAAVTFVKNLTPQNRKGGIYFSRNVEDMNSARLNYARTRDGHVTRGSVVEFSPYICFLFKKVFCVGWECYAYDLYLLP
jgi:hypothetical protein